MSSRMTVPAARLHLGKYSKGMSDDQVQELLDTLYLLAQEDLSYNGSKEGEKRNEILS